MQGFIPRGSQGAPAEGQEGSCLPPSTGLLQGFSPYTADAECQPESGGRETPPPAAGCSHSSTSWHSWE